MSTPQDQLPDDNLLSGGLVPVASRPRPVSHLKDLTDFAQQNQLAVGSTTGGRHNRGSKHYTGNAVDIAGSGGFSDEQVARISKAAANSGFLLRDERTRPPRQKVWGGAHVHIEYDDQSPANDPLLKGGLVPQDEATPTSSQAQSVLPPVTQPSDDILKGGLTLKPPAVTSTVREADTGTELPTEPIAAAPPAAPAPLNFQPASSWGVHPTTDPSRALSGPSELLTKNLFPDEPTGTVEQQMAQRRLAEQQHGHFGLSDLGTPVYNTGTNPNPSTALGKSVKVPFSPHLNPTSSDVVQGYLTALGPEYAKYGEQYHQQTGHDILSLSDGNVDRDTAGNFYVQPSQGAVRVLNAYVQSRGNMDAARAEAAKIAAERTGAATTAQQAAQPDIADVETERKAQGAIPDVPLTTAPGGMGTQGVSGRVLTAPLSRFVADLGKTVGGLTSLGGLTPNTVSDYFNRRGAITEAGATMPPLTAAGKEIERNATEKVGTALGDIGFTVAKLVAMKKVTGLPLGQIMALETALKTSDEPTTARAAKIAQSYAMGNVLEGDLGRTMSAAVFGVPTAVEGAQQVLRNPKSAANPSGKSWEDVLLDTAVQGGVGAIMGGGKGEGGPTELAVESAPRAGVPGEATSNIDAQLAAREAAVRPVTDAAGNVLLNADEVARDPNAKPKIKLANSPTNKPAHPANFQVRDEAGKFDGPVDYPDEFKPENVAANATASQSASQPNPFTSPATEPAGNLPSAPPVGVASYTVTPGKQTGFNIISPEGENLGWVPDRQSASENIARMEAAQPIPEAKQSEPSPLSTEKGTASTPNAEPQGEAVNVSRETSPVEPLEPSKPVEAIPEPSSRAGTTQAAPEPTTSIKHAVVEAERELRNLPQFVKARRSHGESFDEGVAAVQNGEIDPRTLAASLVKDPRPLSTKESMALLYDRMRISNAKEQAAAELQTADKSGNTAAITAATERIKQLEDASDANDEAVYRAGSEQGRGLAIRRELINRDYSRAVVTAKLRARNRGKELPADIKAQVDDLTSRLEQANKRIDDLESRSGEQQSLASTDKFVREYKVKLRSQVRARTREQLATERAEIKQQIAAEFRAQKPKSTTLSMGGLGDIDPEGKLTRLISDLARNYIEDGVSKAADIVDAVHTHIKDVANLTKREVSDLISGYGRIRQSTTNPIEKKLNEVKSILAATSGRADIVERAIRPARRGQQREKPTEDQRRALRELQDAMKEHGPELARQPYDVTTEQATPLDKAKTTARNRIEQLKGWIATGKREVQGRTRTIPDAELRSLKAEQSGLEKAAALISDPAADQKAVERRLTELNKAIADSRGQIRSGNVTPAIKEGAKSLWSPEIGAAETERETLRRIITDMRADAARKATATNRANEPTASFYGATDSWEGYEREARRVLNAQRNQEKTWQQKVADLQKQLADTARTAQRQVKPTPRAVPETDAVRVAKRNAKVLQSQIDSLGNVIDWRNRSVPSKALAYTAAGARAGILTGTRTIGKIGSALGQSAVQQYGGELAGEGGRKLFPRTAALAPRHGQRISRASEAEFARGAWQGIKDVPRALKTGETSLTLEAGQRYPEIPTKAGRILSIPGRVHMAEKNILGSGEYARSKEMRLQQAERVQPGARNDPDVQQAVKEAAYKDAKEIMLLGDNPFSKFMQWGRRSLSKEGNDISRLAIPVERVPSNYLFAHLIGEYGLGLPRGLVRGARSELQLRSAMRKAMADTTTHYMDGTLTETAKELERRNPDLMGRLTPEEADKTMRLIKRGAVGLVYMALGTTGAGGVVKFGGYAGGARGKKDIKPGDMTIAGVTIPHWLLHSPPNELAQFAATMKREIRSQVASDQSLGQRIRTGIATGAKGVARQVPFLGEYADAISSLRSGEEMSTQMGKMLAARVEPQIMQELARATDREETETVRRKPKGFVQAMEMGVPGLRSEVPLDKTAAAEKLKADLISRGRSGEKINPEVKSLVQSSDLSPADARTITEQVKLTPLQSRFKGRKLTDALTAYESYDLSQRAQVRSMLAEKANAVDLLRLNEQSDVKARLRKLGFVPPAEPALIVPPSPPQPLQLNPRKWSYTTAP